MYSMVHTLARNDHTIMTAPLPVCSAKLSMIWLRQYYGGGPRWNLQCCSFVFSTLKPYFAFIYHHSLPYIYIYLLLILDWLVSLYRASTLHPRQTPKSFFFRVLGGRMRLSCASSISHDGTDSTRYVPKQHQAFQRCLTNNTRAVSFTFLSRILTTTPFCSRHSRHP